jgi:hypothetical protein
MQMPKVGNTLERQETLKKDFTGFVARQTLVELKRTTRKIA